MVELNETNLIMQHATPYSLAILDEFGRGTSTHGLAIYTVDFCTNNINRWVCFGLCCAEPFIRYPFSLIALFSLFSYVLHLTSAYII